MSAPAVNSPSALACFANSSRELAPAIDPGSSVCEAPTSAVMCGPATDRDFAIARAGLRRRLDSFWGPAASSAAGSAVDGAGILPLAADIGGATVARFFMGSLAMIYFASMPSHTSTYPIVRPYTRIGPVTELAGNPEVGTVVFLRNIHGDIDSFSVDPEYYNSREARNVVACQVQIWSELERGAFSFIALEGTTSELLTRDLGEIGAWAREYAVPLFRSLVNQRLLPRLTREEAEITTVGAGRIYAYANQDTVEMIAADRRGYRDVVATACALLDATACRFQMMDARESYAANQIMEFFLQHPGETVALVFGAAHEFADDFQRLAEERGVRPPRVVSIAWRNRFSEELFHSTPESYEP